ncbi:MAG: cupin domain-containing protein [Saprospiraceae bacterium]
MATQGKSITNKITGEKFTWLETARDSGGKRLRFDFEVAPLGHVPVAHVHPDQDETFEVKKGQLWLKTNGQEQVLRPGDTVTIPKNTPHEWKNPSASEKTEMIVTFEPALNTEIFFEQFCGLSNDGKTKPDGSPNFLQIMAMANAYQIYIAGPPVPVQKVMGTVIGGFARLIGYRKFYPKYSPD